MEFILLYTTAQPLSDKAHNILGLPANAIEEIKAAETDMVGFIVDTVEIKATNTTHNYEHKQC